MDTPLAFLHVAALAVYAGSCLYLLVVLAPRARAIDDAGAQRRLLAPRLRVFNLLTIGALGVLLMTGAMAVTDLKARLGPLFFARLGGPLSIKLALAFVLINIATYVSFGLAHRLVRAEQGGLAVEAERQAAMLRRMVRATWIALTVAALTTWVALEMRRELRRPAAQSCCRARGLLS